MKTGWLILYLLGSSPAALSQLLNQRFNPDSALNQLWINCRGQLLLLFYTLSHSKDNFERAYHLSLEGGQKSQMCLKVRCQRNWSDSLSLSLSLALSLCRSLGWKLFQCVSQAKPNRVPAVSTRSLWQFEFRRVASHNLSASKCNNNNNNTNNNHTTNLQPDTKVQTESDSKREWEWESVWVRDREIERDWESVSFMCSQNHNFSLCIWLKWHSEHFC